MTAADVFAAAGGKVTLLALLAKSAYNLNEFEYRDSSHVNNEDELAADVFNSLFIGGSAILRPLTGEDIPALGLRWYGGSDFPVTGLVDGIYTNGNAAAVLARCEDALFVAFRGTNDTGISDPDHIDWFNPAAHYQLLEEMGSAIADYADSNGINKIYVTGHSLGAAMAQEFMKRFPLKKQYYLQTPGFLTQTTSTNMIHLLPISG